MVIALFYDRKNFSWAEFMKDKPLQPKYVEIIVGCTSYLLKDILCRLSICVTYGRVVPALFIYYR